MDFIATITFTVQLQLDLLASFVAKKPYLEAYAKLAKLQVELYEVFAELNELKSK